MQEISRLSGSNNAIELDFVEREATPKEMMELAIDLHLGGLSLSNTVSVLDSLGISRTRSTVHNWVQKADLEPRGGRDPEKIALDETIVKVNDGRYWLVAVVEPDTNVILHVRLYPFRDTPLIRCFCVNFEKKALSMMLNSSSMARPGNMPAFSSYHSLSSRNPWQT